MKRLQIVDHNINIGHCKDIFYGFCDQYFMVHQTSQFRIPNSEFRILNSEFRIPHFEKKIVYRKLVFGDATSGSVHEVGPFDLKLEQFKQ